MIRRATAGDADLLRTLFQAYQAELDIDLSFQNFEAELSDPLGSYELVLLAGDRGCVALKMLDETVCELKRLFVVPDARGTGLGRVLSEAAIAHARARDYERMRLDTLPSMAAARKLYAALGFGEIEPYRFNPVEGTTFLELAL